MFNTQSAPLKIGWSSCDIYDDQHTLLPGQHYTRYTEQGVIDPVTSTCLVIDNGIDHVIFVSCDVVGFGPFIAKRLKEELARIAPEIDQTKIICSATHTHAGGDTRNTPVPEIWQGFIKQGHYCDLFTERVTQNIKKAWESRQPGAIGYGFGYATVAHQRRAVYFNDRSQLPGINTYHILTDGYAVMYGKTNDPEFSHHETGADATVNFLFTFDTNNKLTGAIINIPCPSQCSENAWGLSADYWHDVRQAIRAKYGKDLFLLSQSAAAGDMSPHLRSYVEASKRKWRLKYGTDVERYRDEFNRKDIAERVAFAFDETFAWAQKEKFTELPLVNRRLQLELPGFVPSKEEYENALKILAVLQKPDKEAIAAIEDKDQKQKAQVEEASYNRACKVKNLYDNRETPTPRTSQVNVVRLGNIGFTSSEFELYTDYMHRIQARAPYEQVFNIQLSTPGAGGYLGTERTMKNRGYGGVAASCNVSPQGGQMLVEETLKLLNEMKE